MVLGSSLIFGFLSQLTDTGQGGHGGRTAKNNRRLQNLDRTLGLGVTDPFGDGRGLIQERGDLIGPTLVGLCVGERH